MQAKPFTRPKIDVNAAIEEEKKQVAAHQLNQAVDNLVIPAKTDEPRISGVSASNITDLDLDDHYQPEEDEVFEAHIKQTPPKEKPFASVLSVPMRSAEPRISNVSASNISDLAEEHGKPDEFVALTEAHKKSRSPIHVQTFSDDVMIGNKKWSLLKHFAMADNYKSQDFYKKLNEYEQKMVDQFRKA